MDNPSRKEERISFRFPVEYEKMQGSKSYSPPVSVVTKDLSIHGLSFYTHERMDIGDKVRLTISLPDSQVVTLVAVVRRILVSDDPDMAYSVGVGVENVDSKDTGIISKFLLKVDLSNILDRIDLKDVVDVYLVAGYPPIVKRFDELFVTKDEAIDENTLKCLLLSLLDGEAYKEFVNQKEYNFIFIDRKSRRFRINLHWQRGKVEATLRVVPAGVSMPSDLGLPPVVENMLDSKSGLILIAGRPGSGKTTSIASMIESLNNKRKGIVLCIEEPIEYLHTNKKCIIKQREVGKDTLSFYRAAKNALRQNPDVLVIGEILDRETMEIAITAAESGSLVISTIHAPDAEQALDRVISLFPADMQRHVLTRLSLIFKGMVVQSLFPRMDGKGLVLATEILVTNRAIRNLIRKGEWSQIFSLIEIGRNSGMQTMHDSLMGLNARGLVSGEYLTEKQ